MSFDSLLRSIKAHRWLALGIFLTCQLITAGWWFLTPQQYKATTTVLLSRAQSLVRTVQDDPKTGLLMSRVALLESRNGTERVVARLGLASAEVLREQWLLSPEPRLTFEDWLAAMISGGLIPEGKPRSYVLGVSYIAPSPEFASALSNAYAAELLEAVNAINQRNDQNVGNASEGGAKRSLQKMQEAHAQLMALSRASGVLQDGLFNTEVRQFHGLSRLATKNLRASVEQRVMVESVRDMKDVGAMLDDPYLKERHHELAKLMAAQAASLVKKGANHPNTVGIEASVLSLKRQIAAYEATRGQSLSAGAQSSLNANEESIKDREAARDKLLASAADRLKYDRAVERFNATGEDYVDASAETAMMGLNSDAPKADMQIMQNAAPPATPWFPRLIYVGPFSLAVGLICMAAACLILNARTKLVSSAQDLSALVGVATIGRFKG